MKKQTKTYILLGTVLIIWGMIGFRVYSSLSTEPVTADVVQITTFRPQKIQEREEFTILADYRDPFLGTMPVKKIKKKKIKKAVPKVPEPEIKYTGSITDTNTQGKIFFITMEGQQYMLAPKEKVGDLTLVSGNANRIKVRYKNRLKTIPVEQ